MSAAGELIGTLESGGHECSPPLTGPEDGRITWGIPPHPHGTVWRCGVCRSLLIVDGRPRERGGMVDLLPVWRRLTWRERWRARKLGVRS